MEDEDGSCDRDDQFKTLIWRGSEPDAGCGGSEPGTDDLSYVDTFR